MPNTKVRQSIEQLRGGEASALNERILNDLAQLGGGNAEGLAFIMSLRDVYRSSLISHLPQLKNALTVSCASDIHHLAHKVKGQSLNLGLDRFAQLLGQLELWPDGFSSMPVATLVEQLEREALAAEAALNQFVDR